MLSSIFTSVTLLVATFSAASTVLASPTVADVHSAPEVHSNSTIERRTFGWFMPTSSTPAQTGYYNDKCASLSGSLSLSGYAFGLKDLNWNFGMVCQSTLDDYCDGAGIGRDWVGQLTKKWLQNQLNSCQTRSYPHGCRPSGNNGAYNCPNGQNRDGTCKSADAQCGPSRCRSNNNVCCPTCTTYDPASRSCKSNPAPSCQSGSTMSNGICCQTGWTGFQTVCCPAGQEESSTWKGHCVSSCPSGQSWSTSSTSNGMCCPTTHHACSSVCCPSGQDESNGHCCPTGSKWTTDSWGKNGRCVSPSPKSRKRAIIPQLPITAADKALNIDPKLCPSRMSACPISPLSSDDSYECLDTMTDITSCGGCQTLGKGQDCSAIKGARFTGCDAGSCQVFSCKAGWKLVNGTSCERIRK